MFLINYKNGEFVFFLYKFCFCQLYASKSVFHNNVYLRKFFSCISNGRGKVALGWLMSTQESCGRKKLLKR